MRAHSRLATAASLVLAACGGATRQSASSSPVSQAGKPNDHQLETIVSSRLDSLPAQSSFYAKQLSSGREIAIRADKPMNTASVIKIPVVILAYRDADAGRLNLDERYTIRPGQMSVGQTFRAVWIAADPKYASMTDREVFERGSPNDSGAARRNVAFVLDSTKWLGRTTAREISRLLEQLERGQLASAASTTEMRRVLRQQVYTSRLPQRIRFRTSIGHKTGDWPPLLGNDVGIMYPPAPAGPIVIAVFTNGNTGSFFDLEAAEGRVADDVLAAWWR